MRSAEEVSIRYNFALFGSKVSSFFSLCFNGQSIFRIKFCFFFNFISTFLWCLSSSSSAVEELHLSIIYLESDSRVLFLWSHALKTVSFTSCLGLKSIGNSIRAFLIINQFLWLELLVKALIFHWALDFFWDLGSVWLSEWCTYGIEIWIFRKVKKNGGWG